MFCLIYNLHIDTVGSFRNNEEANFHYHEENFKEKTNGLLYKIVLSVFNTNESET